MSEKKCEEGGYIKLHEEELITLEYTLNKILEKAIQREVDSQNLYIDLEKCVRDKNAKKVLYDLAKYERDHRLILEKYRRGELKDGVLSSTQVIDYRIAEHLEQPKVSPEMDLPDIFLLAARREKASHEFYSSLAGIHPRGQVRRLLEQLSSQELEHKHKVEFLYTEVAFPQTAGG